MLTDRTRLAQEVNAADIVIYPPVLRDSADDDAFQADIEALAQQQAAALIVFGTLSHRDVKTATAVKLPVLEVTPTANLRDTHKDIAALLLDHQSQLSTRGMELYRDLSKCRVMGWDCDRWPN